MEQDNGNPIMRCSMYVKSYRKVGAHNPYHANELDIAQAIMSLHCITPEHIRSVMSYTYQAERMMIVDLFKHDYTTLLNTTDLWWGKDYSLRLGMVHQLSEEAILADVVPALAGASK